MINNTTLAFEQSFDKESRSAKPFRTMDRYSRVLSYTKKDFELVKTRKNMTAEQYYSSKYWKYVQATVFTRDSFSCCICGQSWPKSVELHCHHKTYEHFKNELDHLEDLETLCVYCHNGMHPHRDFEQVYKEEDLRCMRISLMARLLKVDKNLADEVHALLKSHKRELEKKMNEIVELQETMLVRSRKIIKTRL